jgi:S1-C subfamily serine protease
MRSPFGTPAQPDEVTPAQAPPPRKRTRALVMGGAAVVLLIAAAAFLVWDRGGQAPTNARPRPSASPSRGPLSVAEIYATLQPSVVSIKTESGSGTGVVVNAMGMILTALHVVQDAKQIEVAFADGTRSTAEIAGADPANDIAALTARQLPSVLVPAVLGGGANIGDPVVAIGDQLGLTHSVTSGVVSGTDRAARSEGGGNLKGLIQFDAAVNPGSSGGPLLNGRAEIIGIVVALANPTQAGTFVGIGFAVPIGSAVTAGGEPRPPV